MHTIQYICDVFCKGYLGGKCLESLLKGEIMKKKKEKHWLKAVVLNFSCTQNYWRSFRNPEAWVIPQTNQVRIFGLRRQYF